MSQAKEAKEEKEKITMEGIPTIDQDVLKRTKDYCDWQHFRVLDWDGRRMLIWHRLHGTSIPQLFVLHEPKGALTQLTRTSGYIGGATMQPNDCKVVIVTQNEGGKEWEQHYLLNTELDELRCLTKGGNTKNSLPIWSPDGQRIVFRVTNQDDSGSIVIMQPEGPQDPQTQVEVVNFDKGAQHWEVVDWYDGYLLILETIAYDSDTRIWICGEEKASLRCLTEKKGNEKVCYKNPRFDRQRSDKKSDDLFIWTISDKEHDHAKLARVHIQDSKLNPKLKVEYFFTDVNLEVENFDLASNGLIAYVLNNAGFSDLYVFNPQTGYNTLIKMEPRGVLSSVLWNPEGTQLVFNFSAATSPLDVHVWDSKTKGVTQWTECRRPHSMDWKNFAQPEEIKWKSLDTEITGLLYISKKEFKTSSKKRPVVINVHGGPEGQSRPNFVGRQNYLLNELGVCIIYPNVRGSTGFGKKFLQMDNGKKRINAYEDIHQLIQWIRTQSTFELDANRILMFGGSYGGHVALYMATHYNDEITATASYYGISNFVTFLKNTEPYRRNLRRVVYGDETDPEQLKFLQEFSPIHSAEKITKPLFLLHGRNDHRVPCSESEQFAAKIKEKNPAADVWLLTFPGEGHGLVKRENQELELAVLAQFVKNTLFV